MAKKKRKLSSGEAQEVQEDLDESDESQGEYITTSEEEADLSDGEKTQALRGK